LSTVE